MEPPPQGRGRTHSREPRQGTLSLGAWPGHLPSGMMTRLGCLEAKFCSSCKRRDNVGTKRQGRLHRGSALIRHHLTPSILLCQPAPCGQVSAHPAHPTSHASRPAHHGHHLPQQQKLPAQPQGALGTAHPMAVLPRLSVPWDCAQGCSPVMETLTHPCLAPRGCSCTGRCPALLSPTATSLTCARCPLGSRQAAKTHSGGFGSPSRCRTNPRPIPRLAPVTRTERTRSSPILILLPLLQRSLFVQFPNASYSVLSCHPTHTGLAQTLGSGCNLSSSLNSLGTRFLAGSHPSLLKRKNHLAFYGKLCL